MMYLGDTFCFWALAIQTDTVKMQLLLGEKAKSEL